MMIAYGPLTGYCSGFYWWPAGRLSRGRRLYAIHRVSDPAGAARRIASLRQSPPGR
jgi:hypothetical protein